MNPNLQFAKSVLDRVADSYNQISNDKAMRKGCLDELALEFKSEEVSGLVAFMPYGQIFPAYKDKVTKDGSISHRDLDTFHDFYVDFVSDLKDKLGADGKIEIISYKPMPVITRSKSPSIEAYEYVGHNHLKFNPRR